MKTKQLLHVATLSICLTIASGCGTAKYGDGKVGSISIDPAVEYAATLADGYVPGSGAKIRSYADGAKGDRVPTGYVILWRSYLNGVEINEADIQRVPDIVPATKAAPAIVIQPAPPAAGEGPILKQSLQDAVRGL